MRLFSTAALSLALVATAGLMTPGTALAKKKEEEKGQQLHASAKFVKSAMAVQDLIAKKDLDGALAKMPEAEATAETPDDHYFLGSFYFNIGIGKQDQALQRKGLDEMLASGKVAQDMAPRYEVEAGKLAQLAKDLPAAREHYNKAIALGNTTSDPYVLLAETYFSESYGHVNGNQFAPEGKALVQQGLPYLKKAIEINVASGTPAPDTWYARGMKMAVLADAPDQFDWCRFALINAPTPENWRLALRALQDANGNLTRDEDIDILRLMAATKSLSNDYSYNEYAEAAWRTGLPGEVVSLIDAGAASGEIKKDRYSDLYKLAVAAIPKDKATLAASEADAAKAATGKQAAATANAYLSYGQNDKAAALYRLALSKGGVDADQVNTRLGIALARAGDTAGAKAAFAAVSDTGLRGQIAKFWTVWVDTMSKASAQPAASTEPAAN